MSKAEILKNIKKNKPQLVELPEIPDFSTEKGDYTKLFSESLTKAGGELIKADDIDLQELIQEKYSGAQNIVSVYKGYDSSQNISDYSDPHQLQNIDLAVIKGDFGVAENGAIWVEENSLTHRVLPFITENLIIILDKDKLVENMHQAYKKIEGNKTGLGIFISGPSKTADIEQSLVIGAHGAKSLYVFIR
ncbi:MAG: LUD domain-containing protein [Bacteroidota bacterium]